MSATPHTLRFSAANSRDALAKVRVALGADALVLSSRRTASGFEVLAAAPETLERLAQPAGASAGAPAVLEELRSLSGRIAEQLGRLAWSDEARRQPLRSALAQRIMQAGFSAALARRVTAHLPDDYGEAQARRWLAATLARNLPCADAQQDLVMRGGVYALVGPTGVGKTTTVAKLAARCVVRHGAGALGLVSTDSYRIGAFDQLRIYGRILGVPVYAAHDGAELEQAAAALSGKHLVLLDTVGIGQRDARMCEHLALLARPGLRRVLVLSAAAQPEAIEDAVLAYRGAGLEGIALTKIDEAVRLGGALDVAIRHRLGLVAVANGQRVPEDLHAPNAAYLVDRALRSAARNAFTFPDEHAIAQLALAPGAGTGGA